MNHGLLGGGPAIRANLEGKTCCVEKDSSSLIMIFQEKYSTGKYSIVFKIDNLYILIV